MALIKDSIQYWQIHRTKKVYRTVPPSHLRRCPVISTSIRFKNVFFCFVFVWTGFLRIFNWDISVRQYEKCTSGLGICSVCRSVDFFFLVIWFTKCQLQHWSHTSISIALESSAIDILACFDHSKGNRSAIQSAVEALEQWSAYNIFSWTQRSAKNWLLTSREPTPVRRCNRQLQGTWTCCPNQILGVTMSNTFKWNCHVSDVIKRANKLTHFLILLKRVNIPAHDIMCFHLTCIRPVFEYCAPLYPRALLLI